AGGLLSACGGGAGPEPQVLAAPTVESSETGPEASASATPAEPSPSPAASAASQIQSAAEGRSDSAAQAFALFYLEVYNEALKTGDTALLKSLAKRSCETCATYVRQIRETYDAGGTIEGGDVTPISFVAAPDDDRDLALIEVEVKVAEQRFVDDKGKAETTFPVEKGDLVFREVREDGRWVVKEITRRAPR
ncbi:MAG: DUF6318 family protein, partial [Pseudonocardiaceae bacterium]